MEEPDKRDSTLVEREKLNEDISLIYRTLVHGDGEPDDTSSIRSNIKLKGSGSANSDDDSDSGKLAASYLEEGEIPLDESIEEMPSTRKNDAEENPCTRQSDDDDVHSEEEETDATKVQEVAGLLMNIEGGDTSASPETCLMVNRAYQEALKETINSIEIILSHSRERQKALEEEIESGMSQTTPTSMREKILANFGVPYFKDARGMHPPPNDDVLAKNAEYDPYEQVTRMWTEADSQTLMKAVAADSLKKFMQPLMNRKAIEIEKLEASNSEGEKEMIRCRLDDLETDITRARFMKKESLYGDLYDIEAIDKIDWMKISAFDFDGMYSETYLKSKWKNHVHPSIDKTKWTQEEDEHLASLAETHRFRNWDTIALSLNTNRSAFQCLQRYQTKLSPSLAMGPWTPEEDDALRNVVETFTFDNYIAWHQVSCYMEGRTREQCMARWESFGKKNKKGRWTTEEDVKLLAAVHCYGQSWQKVQQFVPFRTMAQIRERWSNSLAQELKYGNWTYEEDRQLILSVERHGERWASIAREMEGRTDNMLLQRYRRLMSWKKENQELGALPRDALEIYQLEPSARGPKKQKDAASLKVRRLLEQKKAQEIYLEKERNSDLILKVEADNSDNDGGDLTSTNRDDLQETTGGQCESRTNTEKASKHEMGVLNLVARRTYAEREKNWQREKKLIEEDLKKGIYVPRPPDTSATRVVNYVEKRKTLHQAIMKHVHDTLKTTAKGDPQVVFEKLRSNLASKDLPLSLDETELDTMLTDPSPTVLNLLCRVEAIKKGKQRQDIKNKRTIMCHDGGKSVEMQIMKLLREKNSMKRKIGRPRKYLDDSGDVPKSSRIVNKERSVEIEKKICSLMLTTMNVDRLGSSVMSNAILKATTGQSKCSVIDTNNGETSSTPSIEQTKNVAIDKSEDIGPIVSQEEMEGVKKGMRKRLQKYDFALVHGHDEYNNKLILRSPADEDAQDDVRYLQSVIELESPNLCPRVYRRNLVGQAEKMYHIPPLPPNSTTLRAFKTLLLNRRLLVKNAQNYHVPGALDSKHPVRTDSASQEETTLHKAVASVDKQIPSKVIQSLDRELYISDITPDMLKKLKKQFTTEEIKTAKLLLKRKEDLIQKAVRSKVKSASEPGSVFHPPTPEDSRTKNRWNLVRKAKLTHDYHMLRARFMSLFLWPAMMSSFELPELNITKETIDQSNVKQPEENQPGDSQDTSPIKHKKRRRAPMTGTKKARQQQVKSRAVKEAFKNTMSELKRSHGRAGGEKKLKQTDQGQAIPLRQSRRLKMKTAEGITQETDQNRSIAGCAVSESHQGNTKDRGASDTNIEERVNTESSRDEDACLGHGEEPQLHKEINIYDCVAEPETKRHKLDDNL